MVVISKSADRLTLKAPFHPDLSFHARGLQGRWRGEDTGWTFDLVQETALRERCLALWGVDGRPETAADTVTVKIAVQESDIRYPLWKKFNEGIWLGGREIVSLMRNRPVVRPGRGVKFVTGAPGLATRGIERWVVVPDGSELLVQDVPRMAVSYIEGLLAGHGQLTPLLS